MASDVYLAASGYRLTNSSTVATTASICAPAAPMNAALVRQRRIERRPVERHPRIGGQPVKQIGLGAAFPHRQRNGDGVLLDDLVRRLPPDAGAHRGDQDAGGGQERQVAVQLALNHRRVGAEFVEHGQERLDLTVEGEERVGQGDAAHHRAETSPSFHCAPASSAAIDP